MSSIVNDADNVLVTQSYDDELQRLLEAETCLCSTLQDPQID